MDDQKLEAVLSFYKKAFCVDGEVRFIPNNKDFKINGVVELNDSQLGQFFIARVFPLNKEDVPELL